jgi:3-hydroxyacyl-CoA dehydrogenase/enoyl-CoA hydratase/3-hydroxybutyryl-CoA epimerase
MHFFNPVHRMPLVEIIRGALTSDDAIATAHALARKLDKTPLIVRDGAGFLVNRLLSPYLNEAGWLLGEGVPIDAIDRALLAFGMPMGPLRLLDEIGLDVARHAAAVMHEAFGERMAPSPGMVALEKTTRLGKKGGAGFYRYEKGRDKGVDEAIYAELGEHVPKQRKQMTPSEIQERTVLAIINEGARALEDGIVEKPGDVDLGMITGTGFPPFRGGPLKYADSLGPANVVNKLRALEKELGVRFAPAPLLAQKAERGEGFYAAAPAAASAA